MWNRTGSAGILTTESDRLDSGCSRFGRPNRNRHSEEFDGGPET